MRRRLLILSGSLLLASCGSQSPTAPGAGGKNAPPTLTGIVTSPQGAGIASVTMFTFMPTGAGDPDGDALTYTWSSSDGRPLTSTPGPWTTSFATPGTFDVHVTITDARGASVTATTEIRVGNLTGTWDVHIDAAPGVPADFVVNLTQAGSQLSGTMSPADSLRRANLSSASAITAPRAVRVGVESLDAFWSVGYPPGDDSYLDLVADEALTTMTGRCTSAWAGFECMNGQPVVARRRTSDAANARPIGVR